MRAVFIFAFTQVKRFFRDPVALFFTFLFPLLFLFVFGSLFRGGGDVNFNIALINQSETQFAQDFEKNVRENDMFTIDDAATYDAAKEKMSRGEIDSIIELPETFGQPATSGVPSGELVVYYNEGSPQAGQTLASVMQSVLDEINVQLTQSQPPFTVTQRSTNTNNLSQFDFTFSGIIGFVLLSMGIFGLANQLPAEKKSGTLRRLRATPFTAGQVAVGTMLYYGFVGALSLVLMFIVGIFLFGFDMRGDWLQLIPFLALAMIMMLGFGILIGGWAKNENQSAVLTQVVSFPLMFLSGVFFPRFLMPEWLQGITTYLPLSPVVDGIRYITTEGLTLLDILPQIGIIAAWAVVVYLLAIKLFRWE